MKTARTLFLSLLSVVSPFAAMAVEQTVVAHWEFTTGYDETKDGSAAIYTPNDAGWSASANQQWSSKQPYFLPNSCSMPQEECKVTVHTSDGKWQLTSSGSTPSYLLRLNTASITNFTNKTDYTDGSKHDQFFEISVPTTALSNVKVNFAIGDGSSSATSFGVVYSVDGGESWIVLKDYVAASHWNSYQDATYALNADNKERLIVRMLIQSATKTSNYNLKYVNIFADDFQAPQLLNVIPADGDSDVVPTGKVTLLFNESVALKGNVKGSLKNNVTNATTSLTPVVNNAKVTFAFEDLNLSTPYTFSVPANSFMDIAGNV